MRLLLDSHAFLWFLLNSPRLSTRAHEAIVDADEVWLSHVSVWELIIKRAVGRLVLEDEPHVMAARAGMQLLPIGLGHIRLTATLEHLHGDPFDRLLVAQALDEGLVLVTADAMVQRYPVAWLW